MDIFRTYLCCCLPSASPHPSNDERQPLLNPDILPTAPLPERTARQQRSIEEQQREQETLRAILNKAGERLISISSPSFLSPTAGGSSSLSLPSGRSPSPSRSRSSSASSSPTLTSSLRPRSTYRAAPEDAPPAPVRARVVRLSSNWEDLDLDGASTPGGQKARAARAGRRSRPPSSHSMRTLPGSRASRGAGADGRPSPLRQRTLSASSTGEEVEFVDGDAGEDNDDADAGESRFDTITSYRTARSGSGGGGTVVGSYVSRGGGGGLREMWGTADEGRGNEEELRTALAHLTHDIDSWALPDVGDVVAELGGGGGEERK
ncbi:hypothetical protein JCM10213_000551 [Rhodosporidiobolus nylandii]